MCSPTLQRGRLKLIAERESGSSDSWRFGGNKRCEKTRMSSQKPLKKKWHPYYTLLLHLVVVTLLCRFCHALTGIFCSYPEKISSYFADVDKPLREGFSVCLFVCWLVLCWVFSPHDALGHFFFPRKGDTIYNWSEHDQERKVFLWKFFTSKEQFPSKFFVLQKCIKIFSC